jgi:hypothetical protein
VSVARSWAAAIGFVGLVCVVLLGLQVVHTSKAEAGCTTTSVCTRSYGRQVCRTMTSCTSPRVRSCRFVNRCTPQRTCVTRGSMTSCVTRDICRRVEVCS